MQNYKDLIVYKNSLEFAKELYLELSKNPKVNKHGRLYEQITASSTSVFSNLAEFAGCNNIPQQAEKLRCCIREANETEARLDFLKEVEVIDVIKHQELSEKLIIVKKQLHALLNSIERRLK